MNMISVTSSNLSAVGYEGTTLYISFHSGGTYAYFDVPEHIYQGLMNANSKGTYHAAYIKNSFKYRRV